MVLEGTPNVYLVKEFAQTFEAVTGEHIGTPDPPLRWPLEDAPIELGIPVRISGFDSAKGRPIVVKSTKAVPVFRGVNAQAAYSGDIIMVRKSGTILMKVGGKDIAAGDHVQLDNDIAGDGEDGDIIPSETEDIIEVTVSSAVGINGTITLDVAIAALLGATWFDASTADATVLTVVAEAGDITGDNIALVNSTTIRVGFAMADGDKLTLHIQHSITKNVNTFGIALKGNTKRTSPTDFRRIPVLLI